MATTEYQVETIGRIEFNGKPIRRLTRPDHANYTHFWGDNFFYKVRIGDNGKLSFNISGKAPSGRLIMGLQVFDMDLKKVVDKGWYLYNDKKNFYNWTSLTPLTDYYVKILIIPSDWTQDYGKIEINYISMLSDRNQELEKGKGNYLYAKEIYNFPSHTPVRALGPHFLGWDISKNHSCTRIPKNGPVGLQSLRSAFHGYRGDVKGWDFSGWDTSEVTDMHRTFRSCDGDWGTAGRTMENWNISKVGHFDGMFNWANFNGNLGKWRPGNPPYPGHTWKWEYLSGMFAYNLANTECDLRNWCFKGVNQDDVWWLKLIFAMGNTPFAKDQRKLPNFSCK